MAALDTRKGAVKSISSRMYVLFREGLSTDDVGVAKSTVLQDTRPRAGFKTRRFRKKKSWGRGYRRTTSWRRAVFLNGELSHGRARIEFF